MSDQSSKRRQRDSERIDVYRDRECRYWSKKLGVSADKIRDAVRAVGTVAKDVERRLRDEAEVTRTA